MKGGGLTWAGWLMVGMGGMLMYAGMTGQSLVSELAAALNGKSIRPKVAPATPGSTGSSGFGPNVGAGDGGGGTSSGSGAHPSTIPNPRFHTPGTTPGAGGGSGSW